MNTHNFARMTMMAVLCMSFAAPLRAEGPTIKVSSDPWEPWVLGVEGEAATGGTAVEHAEEVFRRIGLDTQTIIYPYERCIHQMKMGERDVLLMVKKTPEREKFMLFSDVIATDPQLIYYATAHRDGFAWEDWKDLKPYTVGGVEGFNYGEFGVAAKTLGINTEMTASDEQNIKKLLAGRVDFIILNRATANFYMAQHPQDKGKFRAAKKMISNAEFHLALSKKGHATAYLAKINMALKSMKADGTADKLLGLTD